MARLAGLCGPLDLVGGITRGSETIKPGGACEVEAVRRETGSGGGLSVALSATASPVAAEAFAAGMVTRT